MWSLNSLGVRGRFPWLYWWYAAFASFFLRLSDKIIKKDFFIDVDHVGVNDDGGGGSDAGDAGEAVPGPTAGIVCEYQHFPACGDAPDGVLWTALHKYQGSSTASWTLRAGLDNTPIDPRTNAAPCRIPDAVRGHGQVQDPAGCYRCVSTAS